MACVISATSSNSGKTLLSLLLISWLKSINKTVQTFKVGPDYLDPQHLSAISGIPLRPRFKLIFPSCISPSLLRLYSQG